jgi:iron complex outermembrane recepter protein
MKNVKAALVAMPLAMLVGGTSAAQDEPTPGEVAAPQEDSEGAMPIESADAPTTATDQPVQAVDAETAPTPALDAEVAPTPAIGAEAVAEAAAPAEAQTPAADAVSEPYDTIPVEVAESSEAPAVEEKTSGNRFVEEIVVTAQKREENVQDVPISVAAFSEELLEASGVDSTNDLARVTPGLTISGSAGFSLIYLRGIGTSAFIPSFDPSVATYVDGIYIPSQQGTLTDLGGVERVEVLKGPQGTLFGRNSTGGAINVVTKTPGASPELSIDVTRSSFDTKKAKFYASYPLTDTLSIAAAGIYSSEGSYYDVVADPNSVSAPPTYDELRPELTRGGRIKVRWQPTDDLDLTLAAFRILQSGSLAFTEPNVRPSPILGATTSPTPPYKISNNIEPRSNSVTTTIYGIGTYSTDWFDTKLLIADQDQVAYQNIYDFDGGQDNIAIFNGPNEPSRLKTAELQFLSNDRGWTPDWLKWIGGLYYLNQEAGFDPFFATVGDVGLIPGLDLLPILDLIGIDPGNGPVNLGAFGVLETNSYSGFAQGTVSFTDWLALTLGARYQEEDRFLVKQTAFAEVLGTGQVETFSYNEPKIKQDNVSYRATLELRPLDDALVYATLARGFKSGSYNIVTLYTVPEYVQPEEVTSYEVGVKSNLVAGLTLNAAAFYNDIKDLQETKLSLLSGGAISAENAGGARTKGVEFDAVWLPFTEWNPGLVVTAGATYIDAIYTEYEGASGFDEEDGLPFGSGSFTEPEGRDFSGNRIARTPRFTGNLGLSQTIDTRYGPLEIAGDYYYNHGFNFAPQNAPATEQPEYGLVNGRVSYLFDRWGLRLTAFGRNLTDEEYADTSLTVDFGTFQRLARPRTYGLTIGYDL